MVSRAYNRVLFALSLLLMAGPAVAGHLQLVIHQTHVQLGQPVDVQLRAVDLAADLRHIDLAALRRNFGVVADDVQRESKTTAKIESRTLHLYPRRTGNLSIPALTLGDRHSRPHHLQVTPAVFGGGPIHVRTRISTRTPWQRQQVVVEMTVSSRDPFFGVKTELPEVPGFEVLAMPPRHNQTRIDGKRYTVQHVGWVLFPLQAGVRTVHLPPVRYVENGLPKRSFYPPQLRLQVRALPPYLPPVVPVGTVRITSVISPGTPVRTGRLSYWRLDVRGDGIAADHLPPVLRALKSSKDLRFFPAQIHRSNRLDGNGVYGEARYRIPFRTTVSGRVPLPALRLMYFNPNTGRLLTRRYTPSRPLSISLAWWVVLWLLVASTLLVGGPFMRRWLVRWRRRRRLRRQAREEIRNAANPRLLRAALATLADAEGWPTNQTIGGWLQQWQHRYAVEPQLSEALNRLAEQCYGPQPGAIPADVRETLLRCLCHPVPRNRIR